MTIPQRDKKVIWHPLTQHFMADLPIPIVRGEGAYLFDQDGKRYLDLISSWWVNLFGHGRPEIASAIYKQAQTLEHVIFAGFTHEPAVNLAEKLLSILPSGFSKVYYSDNGSTAVEIALKMAYQFWRNQGQMQRQRFIAFEKGYHGDTFGAMSVGKTSHYHTHFDDLLFNVDFFAYPETWLQDENIIAKEKNILNSIQTYLEKYANEVAGMIIEPLVQGASGMRMCRVEFLQELEALLRRYGVLIIYDEVMTGFGRTGDYFACLKAKTSPDIICLAKGLSGGFLPLSVTACKEFIYEAFLGDGFQKAFSHSHSFTGNPLGCAAALASLELLTSPETALKISTIEKIHLEEMAQLTTLESIEKLRCCGTIAAIDLKLPIGYASQLSIELRKRFMKQGLLIRPISNVIYLMPPYCILESDLRRAYQIIAEEIQGVLHHECSM